MVRSLRRGFVLGMLALIGAVVFPAPASAQGGHTSKKCSGATVNDGTVTHVKEGGRDVLKLSPGKATWPGSPASRALASAASKPSGSVMWWMTVTNMENSSLRFGSLESS